MLLVEELFGKVMNVCGGTSFIRFWVGILWRADPLPEIIGLTGMLGLWVLGRP